MKYSLENIAKILCSPLRGKNSSIERIITDSRTIGNSSQSLFVAISGANHDGHHYIQAMYNRGVRAFIVEREVDINLFDAGFIIVDNAIAALQTLAQAHRQQFRGRMVAITGSNAKTVVKEWIAQLCPKDINIFRSPKSYNSQLGVALSILMMSNDEDLAIIEAGISQTDEMQALERVISPEVVVLTNIGDAHQSNFASVEQKLEQKLLLATNAKTIIYNKQQPLVAQTIEEKFADKKLVGIDSSSYNLPLSSNDPISQINAAMAVAVFDALGLATDDVVAATSELEAVAMRMELKQGVNGALLINDSYNSDINSLSLSLDCLCSNAGSHKKVVILSDIMQSGSSGENLYAKVADLLEAKTIDFLVGVGTQIGSCKELFKCASEFYETTQGFIDNFDRTKIKDCAVLVKGSRNFKFEQISHLLEYKVHTTTLEVDLDAMIHNLNYFRSRLGAGVGLIAMVKASSYGNGTFEIAKMLEEQGVSMLAVAFADEGVTLRKEGITMPIVVLNADADSFATMIEYKLEPEIYSFSSLASFSSQVRRQFETAYPIHIKLDTGMHRLGFLPQDIEPLVAELKTNSSVKVASIFSHFAVSDQDDGEEFTMLQTQRYESMSSAIIEAMPYTGIIRHLNNSAAIEKFDKSQFEAVRLGIGLYGVSFVDQSKLENVSSLKSRIVQIKTLDKGETVGYGRHGKITSTQVIATIPIGYADGLDRRLSRGRWKVNVNGTLAPIIGNICMDTCMIDITGIEAREGDQVTIFGQSPTILEMAEVLETIPYEIMTSISTRVKRIYTKE